MSRTVYLVVYDSRLFPAHWSLWIPQKDGDQNVGKRIHASGDASEGFEVEFVRNYNIAADRRAHQLIALAEVDDQHVVDVKGGGGESTDTRAHDYLEEIALSIPAPSAGLRSASSEGPRKRVNIQNCQTWLRDVVVALIQNGLMAEDALRAIDHAPKN